MGSLMYGFFFNVIPLKYKYLELMVMYTLNNNLIGSVYKDGLMSTGYICLSVNNKLLYTLILYVVLTSTCTICLNYIKITIMITTLNDKSNSYFQKLYFHDLYKSLIGRRNDTKEFHS